jgi:hypothetical protein
LSEVKEQLKDYNWIKRNIEEARQQVELIKDTIESLRELDAVEYSDMPKAKVISSIVESKAERIELELINLQSWNDRLKKYYDQEKEINEWLDMLNANEREVVIYRAIKNMRWQLVCITTRYSISRAQELYKDAIRKIEKKYRKK